MSTPNEIEPCLPVFSLLAPGGQPVDRAMNALQESWPECRLMSPPHPFTETRYYEDEMGNGLCRWWGYRHILADPADLKDWKKTADELERRLADGEGNRTVNIDPGYLNFGLFVLGSYKYDLQKIAIGEGVYADPLLCFVEGEFQPFEWSFPDFKKKKYYPVLEEFRRRYRNLRNQ